MNARLLRVERGWLVRAPLRGEALAAVDRLLAAGAERHLRLAAAARARGAEHFARTAIVATARIPAGRGSAASARCLPARTARRAPSRLAELTVCVELLLARGEHEFLAAVGAGEGPVGLCVQRNTPSPAVSANLLAENRGEGVIEPAGLFVTLRSTSQLSIPRSCRRCRTPVRAPRHGRCAYGCKYQSPG